MYYVTMMTIMSLLCFAVSYQIHLYAGEEGTKPETVFNVWQYCHLDQFLKLWWRHIVPKCCDLTLSHGLLLHIGTTSLHLFPLDKNVQEKLLSWLLIIITVLRGGSYTITFSGNDKWNGNFTEFPNLWIIKDNLKRLTRI